MPTPLVTCAELADHLDDPAWLAVDCTFDLADPSAGEASYVDEHIPGAVYAHLDRDLSAPKTGRNGRHPLPDVATMAATFSALGIDARTHVVAYDQDVGMHASRLWWMLRYLGHDAVSVLEGGFARWVGEARPTRGGVETRPPARFTARVRHDMLLTASDVEARLHDPRARLLDARAPERFRGEIEPLDPVAGHIPGAANWPYRDNVTADGTFLPGDRIRERFREVARGVTPGNTAAYCGSGVSACHLLLALEHAGVRGVRLYAGSWSEWSADPARPVERT